MIVYKVSNGFGHLCAVPVDDEFSWVNLEANPLRSYVDVKFPRFYFDTLKAEKGNFYGTLDRLIMDETAVKALGDIVWLAGESITLEMDQYEDLTLLNTLETCQLALDKEKTRHEIFRDGSTGRIVDFVFDPDKIVTRTGLFKIPDNRYTIQFAVTGSPRQELDFYQRYHDANLTGLRFEKMWELN